MNGALEFGEDLVIFQLDGLLIEIVMNTRMRFSHLGERV
jgi:hypothetical protein